jgi:hypothetical protein
MSAALVSNPDFQAAFEACASALQAVAESELSSSLQQRLHELGERKEFLNEQEHAELVALVEMAQDREVERLKAQVALKRLQEVLPELFQGRG